MSGENLANRVALISGAARGIGEAEAANAYRGWCQCPAHQQCWCSGRSWGGGDLGDGVASNHRHRSDERVAGYETRRQNNS